MFGLHELSEQLLVPVFVVPIEEDLELLKKAVALNIVSLACGSIQAFL